MTNINNFNGKYSDNKRDKKIYLIIRYFSKKTAVAFLFLRFKTSRFSFQLVVPTSKNSRKESFLLVRHLKYSAML